MTKQLHFHFSLSCTGEGNGNQLQCSCLENARDGKPGGLPSMGSHRVRHNWSDLAAAAQPGTPFHSMWLDYRPGYQSLWICVCVLSHLRLSATSITVAHQAPLSMGFPRQEYWSGLLFPSPADLPNPGMETVSLMSPALAGGFFTTSATWEAHSGSQN